MQKVSLAPGIMRGRPTRSSLTKTTKDTWLLIFGKGTNESKNCCIELLRKRSSQTLRTSRKLTTKMKTPKIVALQTLNGVLGFTT